MQQITKHIQLCNQININDLELKHITYKMQALSLKSCNDIIQKNVHIKFGNM